MTVKIETAHKSFIKHLEGQAKSASTLVAYGKDIEQLVDHLNRNGVEMAHEIKLEHLEDFMKKLASTSYTPKSISRKTNSTKTFFKFLKEKGHIEINVADLLKHPKVDVKAPRILTKMEYRALRDAARDDIRSYAIIEVLLQTGVLISELSELELAQVELKENEGRLNIIQKTGHEARTIPLNKAVVEAIKNYLEKERPTNKPSKYLFITKSGNPLLVRNIRSTIERYYKAAGVQNAKVNDLRHTFVAHHLSSGVSLVYLSKIAGHKRLSTTERYLQYIEKSATDERIELGVL